MFVTTFDLNMPEGFDIPTSFVFDDGVGDNGLQYRAYLYVNGWQMAKRVANLGFVPFFSVVHQRLSGIDVT